MAVANIYHTDAFEGFKDIPDNSIDAILTDPPYFIDGHKDDYDDKTRGRTTTKNSTVSSLRAGMKFDAKQGKEFQEFSYKLGTEAMRILKPGGFLLSFSAPRLYHRLAVGIEDSGFEIRDMWQWLYTQNQMKAMGLTRGIERLVDKGVIPEDYDMDKLKGELLSWKTPQVKSCFEPVLMAQKPREGTFLENWVNHHVGLVNVKSGVGENENMDTSNVVSTEHISDLLDRTFLVGKPTKGEKGVTTHVSVKPLAMMKHLAEITVPEGGVILDPFNGSGTTGIATLQAGRNFIGFEKAFEYFEQSIERNEMFFEGNRKTEGHYQVEV